MSSSSSDDGDVLETFELHDWAEAGDVESLKAKLIKPEKKEDLDFNPEAPPPEEEEEEVNIDQRDNDDCTPLHVAILNGQLDAMQVILDAGAEVLLTCEGSSPLHVALAMGQLSAHAAFSVAAVPALLAAGAEPSMRDDRGFTALHVCAALSLPQQAATLLAVEGYAEQALVTPDKLGLLPLHHAARCGGPLVQMLLDAGADAAAESAVQRTPLHEAAAAGCVSNVATLMAAAAGSVDAVDAFGFTPAALAARAGHEAVVKQLGATAEAAAAAAVAKMLVVAPEECHTHVTHAAFVRSGPEPPPENDNRLTVLTHPTKGILHSTQLAERLTWVEQGVKACPMGDILRVHDWPYIKRVQDTCARLALLPPPQMGYLDGDTAICATSFSAARYGAGAVLHAIDSVVTGRARHAFCATRPPGHHAGPSGLVPDGNDPNNSHGFCLLSNVALGAAYARVKYGTEAGGVARVALLDFDVHHGNGTQAVVQATVPSLQTHRFSTPFAEGAIKQPHWKPWVDLEEDRCSIFLAGTQGYGAKMPGMVDSWFYPGSGGTFDTAGQAELGEVEYAEATGKDRPRREGPRILNVGIPGPGARPDTWRRAWGTQILPALDEFKPQLIMISAGFDAHRKDDVNCGYVGLDDHDFHWVTDAIVQVANKHCPGRIVSVLEGGYRIQGGVVSAFARSAAAHVSALAQPSHQRFDKDGTAQELFADRPSYRRIELAVKAEAEAGGEGTEAMETEASAAVAAADAAEAEEQQGRNKRRRGGPVDYAALNAKLEAEQAAAAAAPPPSS